MDGSWDGFLDAYQKVKGERDDSLRIAERAISKLTKGHKEKIEPELEELKERVSEFEKSA